MQLDHARDLLGILRDCATADDYDAEMRLAYIAGRVNEFLAADAGDYTKAQTLNIQNAALAALMTIHHNNSRPAPIIIGGAGHEETHYDNARQ